MAPDHYPMAVTFDVDLVDYGSGAPCEDEFALCLQLIEASRLGHPDFLATVFLRLDREIGRRHGAPDSLFDQFQPQICGLRQAGHEIAWHPHVYDTERQSQCTDPELVLEEIGALCPLARDRGLETVRIGGGFQTNALLATLERAGFRTDSSAIPRPRYPWDLSIKDWTETPQHPYFPSCADYRVPGRPARGILEVPMTTAPVVAPYDERPVLRYLNLAFHKAPLTAAIRTALARPAPLVTITHPYEAFPVGRNHGLLAHDPAVFAGNLDLLVHQVEAIGRRAQFVTIGQVCAQETRDHWKD